MYFLHSDTARIIELIIQQINRDTNLATFYSGHEVLPNGMMIKLYFPKSAQYRSMYVTLAEMLEIGRIHRETNFVNDLTDYLSGPRLGA